MTTTKLTARTIMTAPTEQVAAALRAGCPTSDSNRIGAVEVLLGYNDGDLLDRAFVRKFLAVDKDRHGTLHVQWHQLAEQLADEESDLYQLPSTSFCALRFAAALAIGAPMPELPRALKCWNDTNAAAMLRAFTIALGIDSATHDQVRLVQLERQLEQIRSLCTQETDQTPWGAAALVRLANDEPVNEANAFTNGPALAVAVVDILRVLDQPTVATGEPVPDDNAGYDRFLTIARKAGPDGFVSLDAWKALADENLAPGGLYDVHRYIARAVKAGLVVRPEIRGRLYWAAAPTNGATRPGDDAIGS